MENFVKRMIEEHAQLSVRIAALNAYVYSDASDKDNKVEFANKCIQLSAMRDYERALRARLENQGIAFTDDGEYYEKVANIAVNEATPDNNQDSSSDVGQKKNDEEKSE